MKFDSTLTTKIPIQVKYISTVTKCPAINAAVVDKKPVFLCFSQKVKDFNLIHKIFAIDWFFSFSSLKRMQISRSLRNFK